MQVDCVTGKGELQEVEAAIRALNADAVIHNTERCHIDLGLILNRGLFNPESSGRSAEHTGVAPDAPSAHRNEQADHHSARAAIPLGTPHSHKHDSRIRTVRLVLPGHFDLER